MLLISRLKGRSGIFTVPMATTLPTRTLMSSITISMAKPEFLGMPRLSSTPSLVSRKDSAAVMRTAAS